MNLGLLDMSDPFLAKLFAPGFTPWVMTPGSDLILWARQLRHIVSRMSDALQQPHNAFIEEIVFEKSTFPEEYKQLFDGNVFSKLLRDDENITPTKLK